MLLSLYQQGPGTGGLITLHPPISHSFFPPNVQFDLPSVVSVGRGQRHSGRSRCLRITLRSGHRGGAVAQGSAQRPWGHGDHPQESRSVSGSTRNRCAASLAVARWLSGSASTTLRMAEASADPRPNTCSPRPDPAVSRARASSYVLSMDRTELMGQWNERRSTRGRWSSWREPPSQMGDLRCRAW